MFSELPFVLINPGLSVGGDCASDGQFDCSSNAVCEDLYVQYQCSEYDYIYITLFTKSANHKRLNQSKSSSVVTRHC